MSYRVGLLVLATFLAGVYVLFAIATRAPEAPRHQLFVNGQVLTLDSDNRVFDALSVREGRIEGLGRSEDLLETATSETVVIDLRGRTLMPGIVDAHGHFPGSGQTVFSANLNSPPMGAVSNIDDLVAGLNAMAEQRPDGWIMGWGYDDTLMSEGRHPTREDLDRVSTTRGVAVAHVSGHLTVVNSVALAELGFDSNTPDPEGGIIRRDPNSPSGREPNGVLEETAALTATLRMFDIGLMDAVRMTTRASREYLEMGVTTASAGGMPEALAKLLGPLSRFNVFPQRVALFPLFSEVETRVFDAGWRPETLAQGRMSVPRVKLIADGSLQGYTGYLSEPYHTPFHGDADYRGYPSLERDTLMRQVAGLYERKIQFAIHCNGDASLDDALDAIASAARQTPWPEARPLIIHSQVTRRDQIDRMADLGVTPSFFPSHTFFWGDRHAQLFLGPERAANISPAAWALDTDVRFSAHADTPVTPMDPFQILWSQVNRQTRSGETLGPDQRIGVVKALRAVTIDAAWQVFMDEDVGSLEPGKLADLVVLSGDPLTIEDLRQLRVERTFIGGAEVWSRR